MCHTVISAYFSGRNRGRGSKRTVFSQFAQKSGECIGVLDISNTPEWFLAARRAVNYNTPLNTGADLLPIKSLRLTRLSTSVRDVELWSEESVLASSRSGTNKKQTRKKTKHSLTFLVTSALGLRFGHLSVSGCMFTLEISSL